jgi:hypothetical protein
MQLKSTMTISHHEAKVKPTDRTPCPLGTPQCSTPRIERVSRCKTGDITAMLLTICLPEHNAVTSGK